MKPVIRKLFQPIKVDFAQLCGYQYNQIIGFESDEIEASVFTVLPTQLIACEMFNIVIDSEKVLLYTGQSCSKPSFENVMNKE